jgi:hypothetical protein
MASRRGKQNLTAEQEHTFLQLLQRGSYQAQAARKLGLSPSAISMRKARNPAFRAAVEAAEAGLEMGLVAHLVKAAPKDRLAALAMLERRFPERWSRPEIRAQLTAVNVDTNELARAITAGLALVAARRAAWDEPDQDGDAEPGASTGPPEAPRAGVSHS